MKPNYKKLVPNKKLSRSEAKKLTDFYSGLNHESLITSKLIVGGMGGYLFEFEGMPGKYFYKSGNGLELYVVELSISKIKRGE
jgi:hypothetical protein